VGAIYRQFAVTLLLAMGFSALMALTLTPALCASLLKHEPGKQDVIPTTGFLGWFNRTFAASARYYVDLTRRLLGRPGRWLLVYGAIVAATLGLFLHLPGSFLPDEDQRRATAPRCDTRSHPGGAQERGAALSGAG
jgi:multidrug efflux pump